MIDRLLTVKDAMEIIPMGKTKVTEIINSIPHINTGKKLLCTRNDLEAWIMLNMAPGKKIKEHAPQPKRKPRRIEGLTADGLIPYRKKGA